MISQAYSLERFQDKGSSSAYTFFFFRTKNAPTAATTATPAIIAITGIPLFDFAASSSA
jgi:hypothetical protein